MGDLTERRGLEGGRGPHLPRRAAAPPNFTRKYISQVKKDIILRNALILTWFSRSNPSQSRKPAADRGRGVRSSRKQRLKENGIQIPAGLPGCPHRLSARNRHDRKVLPDEAERRSHRTKPTHAFPERRRRPPRARHEHLHRVDDEVPVPCHRSCGHQRRQRFRYVS